MKFPKFAFQHLFILFFLMLAMSCIKNDKSVVGDAKVRIFNNVISDTSTNFFFDNILFNGASGQTALASSTSSSYFVVDADKEYVITSRNSLTGRTDTSLSQLFKLGLNYSIYYTKAAAQASARNKMFVLQDSVRPNGNMAQVMFINLGYTLGSGVNITDRAGSFKYTIGFGEKTIYVPIKDVGKSKTSLLLNLVDSTGVVDSISYTGFALGKVYTVIIDGTKTGKLKERLVANN